MRHLDASSTTPHTSGAYETGSRGMPYVLTALALLLTHIYFVNVWPRWVNPNVSSRTYMALAIVDHGSLQIDPYVAVYDTGDKAGHDGHYYSDKAPGYAFLLVPVAWLLRMTLVPAPEWKEMVVGLRLLGLGVPVVLFWLWASRYYARISGDGRTALAVMLAGALGTNFFVYGTHLFSHAPAGVLLFAVFLCLRRLAEPDPPRLLALATGFILAVAFVTDFILLLTVAMLGPYALWTLRTRLTDAALFCFGCAVPLGLWLWMNAVCYGSPFTVGFHLSVNRDFYSGYQSGFKGIQWPDLAALAGMWIDRERGMLLLSPFLVLAPFGFARLWQRGERRDVKLAVAIIISLMLFASTTLDWRGGWSVGVRYLVPAIPFMLIGVAGAFITPRDRAVTAPLFQGLVLVSIVLVAATAATFPFFPPVFRDPLFQLALPMAWHSVITQSTLFPAAVGVWPWALLIALCCTLLLWLSPVAPGRRGRTSVLALAFAAAVLSAQWSLSPPMDDEERKSAVGLFHYMGYGR